ACTYVSSRSLVLFTDDCGAAVAQSEYVTAIPRAGVGRCPPAASPLTGGRVGGQTGRDRLLATLREILELPALQGTRLHGGAAATTRDVRWLATVHIRPTRPQQLRSGELLLLPPPTVAHASLGGGWATVVRQLRAL